MQHTPALADSALEITAHEMGLDCWHLLLLCRSSPGEAQGAAQQLVCGGERSLRGIGSVSS